MPNVPPNASGKLLPAIVRSVRTTWREPEASLPRLMYEEAKKAECPPCMAGWRRLAALMRKPI